MLRVTFFFLFFENIPVVVDIQRIINKLLSNPNHRPSFETTVLIADDIFRYIKNDFADDSQ